MAGSSDAQALLLQVSADVSRLQKQFDKAAGIVDAGSKKMERRAQQASTNLERFFGKTDPAKALDKVFDATRFKVLDSGIAKIGLMGGALESLGPAGLAAAAGIGAVAAAFAGAREAAKFADDISDTANRLHVTTDALQEYRYAIRAAGGEEAGADEALEAFSITLGKAHEGAQKALKGFAALGFTKAQVDSFKDSDTALKAVTERLQGLSDVDRDAVISQLGLGGLKPALDGGIDKLQQLRQEAHKVGIVMDAELVKRGGDLNDQFETVSKVIDIQLKSSLVDLGPVLVKILQLAADLATEAAHIADSFRSIENKRRDTLVANVAAREKRDALPVVGAVFRAVDREPLARERAELAKRVKDDLAPPAVKPTRSIVDLSKSSGVKAGPRDDTVQRTEEVKAALAGAEKSVLQALLGLTQDVEARAAIQKQIIGAESAQADAANKKRIADIEADKGLAPAKRAELASQLQIAGARQAEVALLEKQRIDQETADQVARQALEATQASRDAELALLDIRKSLSRSSAEQQTISLRLVEIAYEREKADIEGVIAAKGVSQADKEVARRKLASLDAQQPGKVEDATRNGSDPARQANAAIDSVKKQSSLGEDYAAMYAEIERQRQADIISEQEAAQAKAQIDSQYLEARLSNAQSFFGNLATLSSSGNKTLSAIGKAAAITQATIDGILAVQKALASAPPPLNFALAAAAGVAAAVNVAKIAGLADGGPVVGPGGPRDDKVLTRLSNGEFVVNAKDAAKHQDLLHAINSGRTPAFADGGFVGPAQPAPIFAKVSAATQPMAKPHSPRPVQLIVHVDAGGAIPREQIEHMVRRGAADAVVQARALSAQDFDRRRYHEDLNS